MKRLDLAFFQRDVLTVCPELPGKFLVINHTPYMITEVEAYRGEEDMACHAKKGRTERTEVMYRCGGHIYVYLIYGMYWMFNLVTGPKDIPQAALIRGIEGFNGPGKLTRYLKINKSFYGENVCASDRIWLTEGEQHVTIKTSPRIGIDYAGEPWVSKPWRFFITP
ncbi:MAG: DNA-3-methyladenine glycosylase [Bacteroidales bacterium]|nr:DNA-3-methyladenine glycosylase [Bacteroidales bacterium]